MTIVVILMPVVVLAQIIKTKGNIFHVICGLKSKSFELFFFPWRSAAPADPTFAVSVKPCNIRNWTTEGSGFKVKGTVGSWSCVCNKAASNCVQRFCGKLGEMALLVMWPTRLVSPMQLRGSPLGAEAAGVWKYTTRQIYTVYLSIVKYTVYKL